MCVLQSSFLIYWTVNYIVYARFVYLKKLEAGEC